MRRHSPRHLIFATSIDVYVAKIEVGPWAPGQSYHTFHSTVRASARFRTVITWTLRTARAALARTVEAHSLSNTS